LRPRRSPRLIGKMSARLVFFHWRCNRPCLLPRAAGRMMVGARRWSNLLLTMIAMLTIRWPLPHLLGHSSGSRHWSLPMDRQFSHRRGPGGSQQDVGGQCDCGQWVQRRKVRRKGQPCRHRTIRHHHIRCGNHRRHLLWPTRHQGPDLRKGHAPSEGPGGRHWVAAVQATWLEQHTLCKAA